MLTWGAWLVKDDRNIRTVLLFGYSSQHLIRADSRDYVALYSCYNTPMTDNKFSPGQVKALSELIAYQEGSIVSRMLMNQPHGSVTLFALAEGQGIAEHKTPYDAMVQVIEGEAEIIISGKTHKVSAGEVLVMPANDPHSLKAIKAFKMLLTMIK